MGKAPGRRSRKIQRELIQFDICLLAGKDPSKNGCMTGRRSIASCAPMSLRIISKQQRRCRINDKLTWFRVSDATTGEPIALTM